MKQELLRVYNRPDTFKGYHRANHYHIPTKLECVFVSWVDERMMGIMVNGHPLVDTYEIREYNYKDAWIFTHQFDNRDDANRCVKGLLNNYRDFKIQK